MHFLHNEVSSEAIQGYLRQGTQIEQVWQQVDEKVTELTLQGMMPWDAYTTMGYALAFVRACRLNVIVVQKLLEGADPKHTGYIPRITYDQAQTLGELFEPSMEEAIKALDPRYVSSYRIPLRLRRVRAEGQYAPAHLLGVMAAGREAREWAAGLVAQYEVAIGAPRLPIPSAITAHLQTMKNQLALGDFHMESGANLLGGISDGKQLADAICLQGEDLLWEAMEGFYQISQLVAYPGARVQPSPAMPTPAPQAQPSAGIVPAAPIPSKRAQTAANVSDLLGQLGQAHPPGKPAPSSSGASDLLHELQMKAPAGGTTQPATDASTLLDQLHLTTPPPPAKPSPGAPPTSSHEQQQDTGKHVADLLSDIGGEQ